MDCFGPAGLAMTANGGPVIAAKCDFIILPT